MWQAFKSSWALFLGIALIMVGNGLQGSLLGVRASMEAFDTTSTGLVMSAFYIGFVFGSSLTPSVVRNVGHIRVFAAWASLASAAVLLHSVFVTPVIWVAMRALTGFAYAGMYVVAESWLNDRSDNATRGVVMSLYMVVQYAGLASGQFLLNVADPEGFLLFIVVSVLVSCALVPISLSSSPAPLFDAQRKVTLRDLFTLTPFGLVGCIVAGTSTGALLGMGAVFAQLEGLTLQDTSLFMAAVILGGVIFQVPIGRLSDRIPRRVVIIGENLLAALVALGAATVSGDASIFIISGFLVGGLSLPLYALALAHANDDLEPDQMVAASSALVLAFGLGAALGPIMISLALESVGGKGFFASVGGVHAALAGYGLYRRTRRPRVEEADRGEFLPAPISIAVAPEAYEAERVAAQEDSGEPEA